MESEKILPFNLALQKKLHLHVPRIEWMLPGSVMTNPLSVSDAVAMQ